MLFNPLNHPITFSIPKRLTPLSFWHEHIPFAMFLVDLLRPKIFVELGTQYGDSYCSFCHSVQELNVNTRCYGVDNWQGDAHVGSYGPEILADLRAEHDHLYGSFSRLVQSTFDDALQHFADSSIDLLHIDGYHVYEAVKHDFESWLPKMSERGVVLFHDTNVRERDFGVWKLWRELQQQYPHFEFLHGSGLGVLAVGRTFPIAFQDFLKASSGDAAKVREFFFQLGQRLTFHVQGLNHQQVLAEKDHQLAEASAELERFALETGQLQATIIGHKELLSEKDEQLSQLRAERDALVQEAAERHALMKNQATELAKKEEEISRIGAENGILRQEMAHLRTTLEQDLAQLQYRETDLLRIYQSHGWKALALYYRVRDGLLPAESYQRFLAKKIFHFIFGFGRIFSRVKFLSWQLARSLYHSLPVSFERKQRLKTCVFKRFAFLFKDAENYKIWLQRQGTSSQALITESPRASKSLEINNLALPAASSTPLVSIIVPVYNQLDFTLRCLNSIQNHPSKANAEIIVLDDASQDETPSILPAIPGVRHIRNQTNLGFLRSCNRAAAEARGEYLVFLNNDTEVQKDWLDNMLAVFDRFDRVGLVGAKLIYPDGRLQEAGGLIWQDASGANFGRDDDPLKPEYNYVRDTDYCSAACVMIKASLFRSLHGFDEVFAPAYYEDTDLAFKVRLNGYRVLYQPASHVIHFEGGTCGTDLNSGVKSYQQANARKFAAKWAQILPEHYPPQNQDLVLARDRQVIGRCLIVDYWPCPDQDSGSIDLINKIRLFQQFSYKVTFFPYTTTRHYGRYTEQLQQMGVECLYEPFITTLADYLERNGRYFDIVVLCRAFCAIGNFETVRLRCPNTKIIFDTVDLHFLREERAARVKNSDADLEIARQLKRDELEIVKRADCTWVVSQAEASLLKREIPEVDVEWFPFARDVIGSAKGFDARRNIAFIGGYWHEPNVDAVSYFAKEIWPHIVGRLEHVQFLIVGSNMPISLHLLADDRIRAIGYVEDLTQFLENCRLTVAPLRYGAGIKGKIATSFAHGVPVIASPIAAEGMGCEQGLHLLVAETIPQWVDCVVRAYTDETLWRHLSENSQALMHESFSMKAGLPRLRSVLSRLGCPLTDSVAGKAEGDSSSFFRQAEGGESNIFVEKGSPGQGPQNSFGAEASDIRAIAFYLPQYHPIPENDAWWGKGFTEWTYVTRAKPLFREHYQPQLPSELGFYDLRLEEVREAQADLAREHSIYGFCYHYYWFRGQRLLERPLSEMLASGRPDFPFCLCWANENWTRRWDGREQEVLLKQEYSPEADVAFIQELFPVLSDRRYIRVNGKPLLLVYRTESLPDPKRTAEIWRKESIRAGIGDLYLCRVESFSALDPDDIGFDAACQFPPLLIDAPELNPALILNGAEAAFQGKMFDYRGLARQALNFKVRYRRFFGVCPSWDNTPRRGEHGYMWLNSSPEEYEKWLVQAVKNTVPIYQGDERLIFINAWNEWGEGCHLEPDQRYGRAYLLATLRALGVFDKPSVSLTQR